MIAFEGCLLLVLNVFSGLEKDPDAGVLLIYGDDNYSQGSAEINFF